MTLSEATGNIEVLPSLKYLTTNRGVCITQIGQPAQTFPDYPRVQRAFERTKFAEIPITLSIEKATSSTPNREDSYQYDLKITADGIQLSSETQWGAISACSVLEQIGLWGASLPCCQIKDNPTYPWRGLMLDVARHFIEFDELLRTLDRMAFFRLNVLHLHLTDDQGFRFESNRFPKLATEPFYSQSQLAQLVEYAADRAIRVVPELDVPGHTTSWLLAHPEWGAKTEVEPSVGFGIHHACLDPANADVLSSLSLLFEEVGQIFQDEYIHIGGDEVSGLWWNESAAIQQLMQERGWTKTTDVQAHFTNELVQRLEAMGKRVIGWDEVLHPTLSQSVTVQAWRGMKGRDLATDAGHSCIVSSPYYLDLQYPGDSHYAYFPDMTSKSWNAANQSMQNDPRLAHVKDGVAWGFDFGSFPDLREGGDGRILGGEACMWSELVDTSVLSRRVWSRMPLIAERFWNGDSALAVDDAYQRMENLFARQATSQSVFENPLEYPTTRELAGLHPLFDQLEPIKWYSRLIGSERSQARADGQTETHIPRPYDLSSKLDRLIDHLPPESIAARRLKATIAENGDWADLQETWSELAEALRTCKSQICDDEYDLLLQLASALNELASIAQLRSAPNPELENPVGEYMLPIAHTINQHSLNIITSHWAVSGNASAINVGHIHKTYSIDDRFVLQKINTEVFTQPEILHSNFERIYPEVSDLVPELICTKSGDLSVSGSFGVWRLFPFYTNRNFSELPEELCESAGAAFGAFLTRFRGKSVDLHSTIEGFHDLEHYLTEYDSVQKTDSINLERSFVAERRDLAGTLDGDLQVIHGDCKVSNLLFHPSQPKVLRIIDLDTAMVGHPTMDYGDLIRSIVGTANPTHCKDKIASATRGFVREYPIDKHNVVKFARAPAYMSFMLGVRYLTDHCRGNVYFKTNSEGENLRKAQARFQLTVQFEDSETELADILNSEAD